MPQPRTREDAIEAEALRLYRRYQHEVVEALNFCPFARRAREEGSVRAQVMHARVPAERDLVLEAVASVAEAPSIEIGLLIFPRMDLGRRAFERFVAEVREEDRARHPRGGAPLAMAAFHPCAEPDLQSAERLVPFLRRSPDPTIQLVRLSALDRVRANEPRKQVIDPETLDLARFLSTEPRKPLHARIAEANLRTVEARGASEIAAIFEDILADRRRTYDALGISSEHRDRPDTDRGT